MQLTLSSILGWSHKQALILSSQYGEKTDLTSCKGQASSKITAVDLNQLLCLWSSIFWKHLAENTSLMLFQKTTTKEK